MAGNNLLNTGTEDHNTRLPPSEASISAAPTPGDTPSPTVSPTETATFATSLPTLPISELVLDFDTILPPPPFGTLHESKHNPDFRVRNYGKWLKMATILSDFHTLLQTARLSEDQSAFDCLHAHILKVGEQLDSFTQQQSPLVANTDEDPRFKHEDLGKSVVPGRESEWYMVQHEAPEGDRAECDALATKRLLCARRAYEAMLDDVSSDSESDSDGEASISEEHDSEGEDTTLVEDSPEDLEPLHAVSSMTLDGSHTQAAPDSMVADYYRLEVLQRAADFLETIQSRNKATMAAYGITFADLDIIAEDDTSLSEATKDLPLEAAPSVIEVAETLRRDNEAVMATYGISVDDLDIDLGDENEELMDE